MTPHSILFLAVLAVSGLFFGYNVRRLVGYLLIGGRDDRSGQIGTRLRNVLTVAFGQSKLLREPFAGLLHFFIFWGFVILLSAIVETIGEGIAPGFSLSFIGPLYPPLAFLQELVGALVMISTVVAIVRRFAFPPKRLDVHGHSRLDATLILFAIFCIVVSMFGQNGANIALGGRMANDVRFLSVAASGLFAPGEGGAGTAGWFLFFWWTHILLVLGFLNYLPYSKHLHVLSSVPNVFFGKTGPRGALKHLDLQDETALKFGASDVEDLTWKQLLDGYTCTECGRCTASCPAAITGKPLSPKKIIVDIRRRLVEKAPLLAGWKNGEPPREDADGGKHPLRKQLVGDYIGEDELWACTTCMACVQECPVQIEHVDAIMDMRRYLVLNESRFPKELQPTFQNLERNFTPWAFSHSTRADWADGMSIPTLASKRDAAILFWVGCAGAYDARYTKVTRAFARLMQIAGVDFAILGTEEKCTGDPARRSGNEYLAQMLMTENTKVMNGYGVKKIVTTCPHCFNTLLNEYPRAGGNYEVIHHTDFIMGLIDEGRLPIGRAREARITYHDSCYIGRYNGIYDAPREVLESVPGIALAEMPRSRDRGFCCGAGGGRMFMEESTGKRVNVERTEEALGLNPEVIGTACPFCMTMMTDGVKEKEASERVGVKDIAEIVLEAIGEDEGK